MSEGVNIPSSTSVGKTSNVPAVEVEANSMTSPNPSTSFGSNSTPSPIAYNNSGFGFESSSTSSSSLNNNPVFSQAVINSSTPNSNFAGSSTGSFMGKSSGNDTNKRKPSLHVVVPKNANNSQVHNHNGSSESLNKSPHSPEYGNLFARRRSSPGFTTGGEESTLEEKDKELSYKDQRKNYRKEKQRVAQELSTALRDPSATILSGYIKIRGKLKSWTKLYGVLKPGLLLLYKTNKIKSSHWVATVLLHCCKVIERPSKKEGFCFKVFHPLEQSIWATKGPAGEAIGAVVQPLPTTYLICRAPSADDGKCWMDGLELALSNQSITVPKSGEIFSMSEAETLHSDSHLETHEIETEWCHSDEEEKNRTPSEKSDSDTSHIEEQVDDDHLSRDTDDEMVEPIMDQSSQQSISRRSSKKKIEESLPSQTHYIPNTEEFSHTLGEQAEVLAEENKSLLWFLLKQVRPGMDLSRVVLPTFILEPRSFLDKLSDYYYHADLLSKAVLEDDPFTRMTSILKWYLSGFYKKPKGLKKPYNPVLGETFRCQWLHPNGSKTFYIAEQVSHHPPVSAFYVSNKKDGFAISAAILAKSKFYGNSTSAILDGQACLTLLPRGEVYYITMPFAHCKGILLGTLSMELGGQITIACEKTGYLTEMEFKLKSFLSRSDNINAVSGKVKLGRETIASFEGHWDHKITLKDKRNQEETVLWEVTDSVRFQRLTRYTVPFEEQDPNESEKLWIGVSQAILAEDQEAATVEKTKLEEKQRYDVKERRNNNAEWIPKYFVHNGDTWRYKHEDFRPWDDGNDVIEYEYDYMISTLQRHKTTLMTEIIPQDTKCDIIMRDTPSDQVVPAFHQRESNRQLLELLRQLLANQIEQSEQIEQLKRTVSSIQSRLSRPKTPADPFPITNTILAVVFAVGLQLLLLIYWFGDAKLIPDMKRPK